jgi:hypothetical protein
MYPLVNKIQKGVVQFYNHLKGSDAHTFYKALTYRKIKLEKSPFG